MRSLVKRALLCWDATAVSVGFVRDLRRTWQSASTRHELRRRRERQLDLRQAEIGRYFRSLEGAPAKLHIGAGTNRHDGWLDTDLEPHDSVVFLDALEAFPFLNQAFDYVFSEHMIEHIPYKGGLGMLGECYRVMKAGGVIRIATPDAAKIAGLLSRERGEAATSYMRWSSEESLGLYAEEKSELQRRRPEWDLDPVHMRRFFPDPSQDSACFVVNNMFRSYGNQFLYDGPTLAAAMCSVGFADICQQSPGRSSRLELNGLERHDTVIGQQANTFETMVLEGTKPREVDNLL